MALPAGEWAGPVHSTRGTHFVRVASRRPAEMPAFDDLAPALRSHWLAAKREALLGSRIDTLRGRYRVKIENRTPWR